MKRETIFSKWNKDNPFIFCGNFIGDSEITAIRKEAYNFAISEILKLREENSDKLSISEINNKIRKMIEK